MSDTTLDNIRLGKDDKEHDLTRFQKIEEERLNRNFRKLKEDIESLNGSLSSVTGELGTLSDSIHVGDNIDIDKPTVFHETVDVIPRRAYATLSSAGWYRVLTYDSYHADRVLGDVAYRINITLFDWARQMHEITFVCLWGSIKWIDEKSVTTNTNFIDKIRYTQNGSYGYIDVHYTDSSSRKLSCHFDVKADYDSIQSEISANDFVAVADAPVGETILTTYTFSANTGAVPLYSKNNGLTYNSSYVTGHNIRIRVYGKIAVVCGWIRLSSEPPNTAWLIKGIPIPNDEINIIYFDQNSNTCGALYISQKNGEWCINTGGYSQSGHTSGHYLNLTATYIVADSYYAPI